MPLVLDIIVRLAAVFGIGCGVQVVIAVVVVAVTKGSICFIATVAVSVSTSMRLPTMGPVWLLSTVTDLTSGIVLQCFFELSPSMMAKVV